MAKIVNTEAWATVNSTNGTNLPLGEKKKTNKKAAMKRYANRLLAVCVFSFMAGRLGDEMKSIFKRLVMIAVKSQLN
jgi:hypothetical protein